MAHQKSSNQTVWATPESWDQHYATIKRLYIDEDKTLKEVRAIMAIQGHYATMKMFKYRIRKWCLHKNHRYHDMFFILQKKEERDVIRKQSSFVVRGKVVSHDDVLQYFKRREGHETTLDIKPREQAGTPSHISCRTPSPSPVPKGSAQEFCNSSLHPYQEREENDMWRVMNGRERDVLPPLTDGTEIIGKHKGPRNGNCGTPGANKHSAFNSMARNSMRFYPISISGLQISRQISAPKNLQMSEEMIFSIRNYIDVSVESGSWVTDESGYCVKVHDCDYVPEHSDFYNLITAACVLVHESWYIEARSVLSSAFSLVQNLLQADDPKILYSLFDIFLYVARGGCLKILSMLQDYVSQMASLVMTEGHPWRRIFYLIRLIEIERIEETTNQLWQTVSWSFDRHLGHNHLSARECRVELVRSFIPSNFTHSEPVLRKLLSEYESTLGQMDLLTLRILASLGWGLQMHGRCQEAEVIASELLLRSRQRESQEVEISGLQLMSHAQHSLLKTLLAEQNIRQSIELIHQIYGSRHTWKIRNMVVLESWIRGWGRESEANKLQEDYKELVGNN